MHVSVLSVLLTVSWALHADAYAGAGQAINPDGACAAIPCYQEVRHTDIHTGQQHTSLQIPEECCPFPFNYQGSFLGAQRNVRSTCEHYTTHHHARPSQLQSALGFWKTLFAQTACLPRCQSLIFGERFRQCLITNNMYSGNFQTLFESNVCNGACLYANKAVWQPLTNATGPCTGLNTQPQGFACPSGCAALLSLVPPDCRGIASSVTYANYGDFLYGGAEWCFVDMSRPPTGKTRFGRAI